MNPSERAILIAKLEESQRRVSLMTPEEARAELHRQGFCDKDGNLLPEWGGTIDAVEQPKL